MKLRMWMALVAVFFVLLPRVAFAQPIAPSPQSINAVSSGITVCTSGNCAVWTNIQSAPSLTAQITGTMTSLTLTFEGTTDGISWAAVNVVNAGTGAVGTTTTAVGQFQFINTGFVSFRVRCTTFASGGANVSLTRGLASSTAKFTPGFGTFAVGDLLYATSATTIGGIADVAVGQVLTSGGVGVVPAYSAAPTLTGALTNSIAGIAVTSTDGHVLANNTAATSGVTVQQSPRLRFRSNVWNTTAVAANNTNDWFIESVPVSGLVPSGLLKFGSSLNGAATTFPMTLASGTGDLTLTGSIGAAGSVTSQGLISTGSLRVNTTNLMFWFLRAVMASSADGLWRVSDYNEAFGIQLNTGTAAPTVTSCGTGTVTAGSRNTTGQITATGATACTITFGAPAWTNAPFCTITMRNVPLTAAYISAESTTAFTVSGLTAADVFNYHCIGRF